MPTYEYACGACGHEWDQVQRITEDPVKVCPKCEKTEAHRLISRGAGFILKGGGWYSDLYSSSKDSASKTSESAASTESSSKAETKSETKTESKTDGKAAAATSPSTPAASTPASSTSS